VGFESNALDGNEAHFANQQTDGGNEKGGFASYASSVVPSYTMNEKDLSGWVIASPSIASEWTVLVTKI
jgi:methyl-accepting chemotaxis protein